MDTDWSGAIKFTTSVSRNSEKTTKCVGQIQSNNQKGPSPWHVPDDQLWAKAASASVVLGYYAVGCLFTAYQLGQSARARTDRNKNLKSKHRRYSFYHYLVIFRYISNNWYGKFQGLLLKQKQSICSFNCKNLEITVNAFLPRQN